MPDYVVNVDDLQRVQVQLAVQLEQLVTAQVGVEASVREVTDVMTSGIAAAQTRIEGQLDELAATVDRSASLADSARWTGPDSDDFRAGTELVLSSIARTRAQLISGVEAHRAGSDALQVQVALASTVFAQAARSLAVSTALLDGAVAMEAVGYGAAFDGSFGYAGGAEVIAPPAGIPSGVPGFTLGAPYHPPVPNDDAWQFASREPTRSDYTAEVAWRHANAAARAGGYYDAALFFDHYLDASGEPLEFPFEKAVREDPNVRENVNAELTATAAAVDLLAQDRGEFTVNHVAETQRPLTHSNWDLAIGDYQQSSSTTVKVEGDVVTMTTTVHADDRYNFAGGASTGFVAPINISNGQLEEAGLARAFNSHGSLTRTYSWKLGDPPPAIDVGG